MGLCPDVLVEISRYLTLDETITAFSVGILPFLRQAHEKVHLVNPSNRFVQNILQHLHPRQIQSVRFPEDLVESREDFAVFHAFDQLISLNVFYAQSSDSVNRLLTHFPTIRAVSLGFDSEFQFRYFDDRFYSSFTGVTRFQIRCPGVNCGQCSSDRQQHGHCEQNRTITSFIFDSGHRPLRSILYCPRTGRACFLRSIVEFIQSLVNVRRVRFVTDRYQVQTFFQFNLWQKLICGCLKLDRIIIQLLDDGNFTREAEEIEQCLRYLRPGLIFRIKSA